MLMTLDSFTAAILKSLKRLLNLDGAINVMLQHKKNLSPCQDVFSTLDALSELWTFSLGMSLKIISKSLYWNPLWY